VDRRFETQENEGSWRKPGRIPARSSTETQEKLPTAAPEKGLRQPKASETLDKKPPAKKFPEDDTTKDEPATVPKEEKKRKGRTRN